MLVLTRKVGETFFLGHNISVTITRIKGGQVRLGIVVPPDVRVWRAEHEQRQGQVPGARMPVAGDAGVADDVRTPLPGGEGASDSAGNDVVGGRGALPSGG